MKWLTEVVQEVGHQLSLDSPVGAENGERGRERERGGSRGSHSHRVKGWTCRRCVYVCE